MNNDPPKSTVQKITGTVTKVIGGENMNFPGEELVKTALEKFADGVIHKMDEAEQKRNREFTYQLKELELYKGNYDKDIRKIFDDWFGFLQYSMIVNNQNVASNIQDTHRKKYDDFLRPENVIKLKINTMKYCGTETGKALALFSQLSSSKHENKPKFAIVYAACLLMATMKKEVLGQNISAMTMLQVLLTDYNERISDIDDSKRYVEIMWDEMFPD